MFNVNKEIYNLMEELGIFTEARTGQQKKAHQKINRRKREERQRNERDFKSKLNFSHTGYDKDGSEHGTITVGGKTGDIQLHHHSSLFKHNPAYTPDDSRIHIHRLNINHPTSYTHGSHELSHSIDDNKSDADKKELRNLLNMRQHYASVVNNGNTPVQTRKLAELAYKNTTNMFNNKFAQTEQNRKENIKNKNNNSSTVRKVQHTINKIKRITGKSPVDDGHDDNGDEIRADEFGLKNFKNSENDATKSLNRLIDGKINKVKEDLLNPQAVQNEHANVKMLEREISKISLSIQRDKEKLKTIQPNSSEYIKLKQIIDIKVQRKVSLVRSLRTIKETIKTNKVTRRNTLKANEEIINQTNSDRKRKNANRIRLISKNM